MNHFKDFIRNLHTYKRKTIYILMTLMISICFIWGIISLFNKNKDYSTLIGIGCEASSYKQEEGIGYLTIIYNKRNISIKVDDINLKNNLSTEELSNVIGVNLKLTIPWKIIKEYHININNINPFEYLYNNIFDEYLVLQNVFYK